MSSNYNVALTPDIRQAIEAARPAWADADRTATDIDPSGAIARTVTYSRLFDNVEAVQVFTIDNSVLTSASPIEIEIRNGMNSLSLTEAGDEVGPDLIRAAQYVAASLGTPTDISQLTLADLSHLAQQFGVEPHEHLRSLLAQGVGA